MVLKFVKPVILILFLNTIFISTYYSFTSPRIQIKNVDLNDLSTLPQISNTNIQYGQQLKFLISKFKPPSLSQTITIPTNYYEGKEVVQDSKVIYALTLNWIYHQLKTSPVEYTFPFNWPDWVDVSYLNHQISKPQKEKIKCKDLIDHMKFQKESNKNKVIRNPLLVFCKDSAKFSQKEIEEMGFKDLDHMPGFIQLNPTPFKTSESIRLMQGKTYVCTKMPSPHQVIFLNDNGRDLTFRVNKKMDAQELMKKYLVNNGLTRKRRITLNPLEELQKIKEFLNIKKEEGIYKPQKIIHIEQKWFHYGSHVVNEEIDKLNKKELLTPVEQGYLYSLKASKQASESKDKKESTYFRMATMVKTDTNWDKGWHYDWRFFNGKLRDHHRSSIILERLLRNWFKFSQKNNIVSWINHGPLLSWYWNGAIFPFDNDLDIQMPIMHMAKLGKKFNQTLVVEDLSEGMGKYLIDVGTFIHNRDTSAQDNHIDARFLDVDTGLYIDITALSTSESYKEIQSRYFKDICEDEDEGPIFRDDGETEIYNDRRLWFYKFSQLSPLRLSMLEGIPCYVPSQIVKRLKFEYPNGAISSVEYDEWYFVKPLGTWIHESQLAIALNANEYRKHDGIDKEIIKKQISELSEEQLFKLLYTNKETLYNYQLARGTNKFHVKEFKHLFRLDPSLKRNQNDPPQGKLLDAHPEGDNKYLKFLEANVYLKPPFRECLYEFEKGTGRLEEFNKMSFKELDSINVSQ